MRIEWRIKFWWAYWVGRKLVWIRDMDGEVNLRLVNIDPWGQMTCRRWGVGVVLDTVKLIKDGTCEGYYKYIMNWLPANFEFEFNDREGEGDGI
jgi:hypothetical protein